MFSPLNFALSAQNIEVMSAAAILLCKYAKRNWKRLTKEREREGKKGGKEGMERGEGETKI